MKNTENTNLVSKSSLELSMLIISYNTKKLLDKCLHSIYQSLVNKSLRFEVIVVDNASTDGSVELVKELYPQVVLIKNSLNVGFGRANNQGIKKAMSKNILFLNSDTEVMDDAIEKLYRYFKTLPQKSGVGGKLFNPDNTPQPSCGPAYSLWHIFTALFLKGDYLNLTRYSPQRIIKVDWVMGACMVLPREAFREVGGFDEGIFMYMEEIDWQYRAKRQGYQMSFYPDAHFIHTGAGSSQTRTTPILNVFHGFLYYYKKHFPGWRLGVLRVILVLKAVVAIVLFALMHKKEDQKLYFEALKISVS